MTWFPLGPDFTFNPKDPNYAHLSRRNEIGSQAMLDVVVVDPQNPQTIYVIANPTPGGSGVFRTDDQGNSWTSIIDTLAPTLPVYDSPTALAVNPSDSTRIYLGWSSSTFFTSASQGSAWTQGTSVPGTINRIIVDQSTAATATPTLYAGSSAGIFVSPDGGATWVATSVTGAVDSFVVDFTNAAQPVFYAGIDNAGLFRSTDPLGAWTNLNARGIGLPASGFQAILVDFCAQNPQQVYAWFANYGETLGLFASSDAGAQWTQVNAAGPAPDPGQGLYTYAFAVCPNSPGDGNGDVLLFGNEVIYRLTDQSGAGTWEVADAGFMLHACTHAFAFAPQPNTSIPAVFVACDGGLGMSTQLADPASSLAIPANSYDEAGPVVDSPVFVNLNHGLTASALYAYASHESMPAAGYIACHDTGFAATTGTLGWRSLLGGDTIAVAASPGPSGVTVWGDFYSPTDWIVFPLAVFNDTGAFEPTLVVAEFSGHPVQRTQYDLSVGGVTLEDSGLCLSGVTVQLPAGQLLSPVTQPGLQSVMTSSTQYLSPGAVLIIDTETITVVSVNANGFEAAFGQSHEEVPAAIAYQSSFVGQIDRSGTVTQLSQDFQLASPVCLGVSNANPDLLFCAVVEGQINSVLYQTASATTSSTWTPVTSNVPFGSDALDPISAIAIDAADNVYVLLSVCYNTTIPAPIYQIIAGSWTAIASTTTPFSQFLGSGPMVADPLEPNVLYVGVGNGVYRVTIAGGTATWESITANLPGQQIVALWTGNVGTPSQPIVLLRATIAARGVWECNVTPGATDSSLALYMRAHAMDVSWLPAVDDGVANPYAPPELLYHYQSADIKVDTAQEAAGFSYFAAGPENPIPIDHVIFDQLSGDASNLPQQDFANVHVQVNNRSTTASGDVWVWAIFCQGAAGVASLGANASATPFPFWSQFKQDGTIVPALPPGSPWTSIGDPVKITAIDAAHPQVASFGWTIPTAQFGNHHCIVAFANSAQSTLAELTNYNVDELAVVNRQISQKNLTLGPPLSPNPMHPMKRPWRIPIVFNNPLERPRVAELRFDFRLLPEHFQARVRLGDVPLVHASGGLKASIDAVEIPPYGAHVVEIELSHTAALTPGSRHRFHVQQVVDGKVVGGIVVIAPVEGRPERTTSPGRREDENDGPVRRPPLAPWVRRGAEARAKLTRRFVT